MILWTQTDDSSRYKAWEAEYDGVGILVSKEFSDLDWSITLFTGYGENVYDREIAEVFPNVIDAQSRAVDIIREEMERQVEWEEENLPKGEW